jgi:thioesterase CepJ
MMVDTPGARIHVEEAGSGEPLLLIHGLGMSTALWVHQWPVFTARFRTLALDLRGFGRSSKPDVPGAYAIERLAEDVAEVLRERAAAPCHVLGTSMGGFVAQRLALAEPTLVRSLILCHTAPRMQIPPEVLAQRLAALERMSLDDYAGLVCAQALAETTGAATRAWLAGMVAANDKRAYIQVLGEGLAGFDAAAELPSLRVPTLVITGEHDRVLPPAGGEELARTIPGARLVQVPGVGHIGYAENPAAFNAAVLEFLGG